MIRADSCVNIFESQANVRSNVLDVATEHATEHYKKHGLDLHLGKHCHTLALQLKQAYPVIDIWKQVYRPQNS